ncbi:hypothetical protein MNEG_4175 [Monoraphidium neglectum]|uniref:Tbc2 translation factor, chloroplastic n=1 Tax=Monoraphidium neglectum TaxID=145388 RepID=A0A0D2NF81_9CHLO|nr:hypothetical protein MNEG_4175 [Monoraphidium neglectum]KIZ03786.1 hypothetical protein MNEG_4175 [Monoraphidium neglectum]|eukprot:XP_013902805.1 hypothetical protein MNEG_4175 [Monoraphidium neglectum]
MAAPVSVRAAKAVTRRIQACGSADDLAALLARSRRDINPIHTAAALTLLVRLQAQGHVPRQGGGVDAGRPPWQQEPPDSALQAQQPEPYHASAPDGGHQQDKQQQQQQQQDAERLSGPEAHHHHSGGAGNHSTPLGAAALGGTAAGAVERVTQLCLANLAASGPAAAAEAAAAFGPRELSTVLWALARLDVTPPPGAWPPLLERLLVLAQGGVLSPRDASTAVWALGRLQLPAASPLKGGWLPELLAALLPAVAAYPPRSLLVLMLGLARLGAAPLGPSESARLLAASGAALGSLRGRELTLALWATAAALQLRPPADWMAAWLRAAMRVMPEMTAAELTTTCVSLAHARYRPPPGWASRLAGQLYWTADQFEGRQLVTVGWALGRLGIRVPGELAVRLLGYAAIKLAAATNCSGGADNVEDGHGGPSSFAAVGGDSAAQQAAVLGRDGGVDGAAGGGDGRGGGDGGGTAPLVLGDGGSAPAPRDVALLLHAHTALRVPLEAVRGGPHLHWRLLRGALPAAGPHELTVCAWALAAQGYELRREGGLDLLSCRLAQLAPTMGPQALAVSAWALAKLADGGGGGTRGGARAWQQDRPRSLGGSDESGGRSGWDASGGAGGGSGRRCAAGAAADAWVAPVVARSVLMMGAFGERELCALLTALNLAAVAPPPEWAAAAGGRLRALAPRLGGPGVVKALDALHGLGVVPSGPLLAMLAARVEALEAARGLSPASIAHCQRHLAALNARKDAALRRVRGSAAGLD